MNIDFTEIGLDSNRVQATLLAYEEPHRFYHNRGHINKMLNQLNKDPEITDPLDFLLLAAAIIYHDAVYVWGSKDNEEKSSELLGRHFTLRSKVDYSAMTQYRQIIEAAILDTAPTCITSPPVGFQGNTRISDKLREYDLWDLHYGDKVTIRQNLCSLYSEANFGVKLQFGGPSSMGEFIKENMKFVINYSQSLEDPSQVAYYLDVAQEFLEDYQLRSY